jgi:DNA mismatch endonuclease (patch repair protein)
VADLRRRGVPPASSDHIRRRMQTARRRDTGPELAIRSILHRWGLRYFVDRSPLSELRRRADIVFPRRRVAVYVDGCFWHGCPQHGTKPKANGLWWEAKIEANRRRDQDTDERLQRAGWIVLRFWEHEDPERAAAIVRKEVLTTAPLTAAAVPQEH